MRTVENRMRDAVENLGCDSGCDSMAATGHEMSHLANLENLTQVSKMLEKYGFLKGKVGGGGETRTLDSADMSRVL